MILGCEDCGENLPYVEVDGYIVGGEQLEGVIFHFLPNRSVRVRFQDAEFFDTLNKSMWLKRIQKHVMDGSLAICPKCKKEAYVEE